MNPAPSPEALLEEHRRVRQVQFIVSLITNVIVQGRMSRREAEELVTAARARILRLFPGAEETYDVLYTRRFQRLLDDHALPDLPRGAAIIPFPKPGS